METQGTLRITRSRWSAAYSFLVGAVGASLGAYIVFGEHSPFADDPRELAIVVGLVAIVVFGWVSIVGLIGLVRPGVLQLAKDGYRLVGLLDGPLIRWADVEHFEIAQFGGSKWVAAKMFTTPQRRTSSAHPTWLFMLLDGDPLSGSSMPRGRLVETLESWRTRYN